MFPSFGRREVPPERKTGNAPGNSLVLINENPPWWNAVVTAPSASADVEAAVEAHRRIAGLAQTNALGLDRAGSMAQAGIWVGGGAPVFSKELFHRRTLLQQAFQRALDEIAELIARRGGTPPPRIQVVTAPRTTMSAGPSGFRGMDVGQMESLVRELDRIGPPLLEAGSQMQNMCSRLCVAPGAGHTIGEVGTWSERQARDLRRRLEVIKRTPPITESGVPFTGPFPSPGTVSSGIAAYEFFGAFDTTPNKARSLLGRAATGDTKALEELQRLQGEGKDPDLARRVNAWWRGLDPAARSGLTGEAPGLVGSLNGVPSATRDTLNRAFLTTEEKRLKERLAELDREVLGLTVMGGFGLDVKRAAVQSMKDRTSAMLKASEQVRAALAEGGKNGRPPALLLLFDANAPHGRAVVSYGDPDRAHHITAYVPGLTTQVENSREDFQRSLFTWDQANGADPFKETASIAWLGYDAPQVDLGLAVPGHTVATSGAAEKGAKELLSFIDGVHATHDHEVPTHLTVVGHSYGSLTTGKAAAQRPFGTFADDLVFVGSPGVGVEQAVNLGVSPEHVWVGANDWDPVSWAGWFTTDPSRSAFGATRFRTGGGGHSDYWVNGKDSLRNIGRIVAGKSDEVTGDTMILAGKP
ncbi:hypothetical protein GCM10017673_21350 [Streptosporangium violaceochromogenes]|nr:hypothetical protein GCM10017673_21350 [Streptosporangium violaceochromogenes]